MSLWRVAATPVSALVLTAVAHTVTLSVGAQPWDGEVLLTATWVWTSTHLCGALLATIAAWDGGRLFNPSSPTVWSLPSVRKRLVLRLWLAATACAAMPALGLLTWMMSRAQSAPADSVLSALFVTIAGLATLSTYVGAGLALGARLGTTYGTLAAFGASFVAQITSYLGASPVLMVGGVSDSLLGLRLTMGAMAIQTVGLLLLISAVAVSLFRRHEQLHLSLSRGDVLLIAAWLISLILPRLDVPRYERVSDLQDQVSCVQITPDTRPPGFGTVCMSAQHRRLHSAILEAWSTVTLAADRAGVTDFPSELHELPPPAGPEDVPAGPPGHAVTFTLTADQLDSKAGTVTVDWLITRMTDPTWCSGLWGDEPPGDVFFDVTERARAALRAVVSAQDDAERSEARAAFAEAWPALASCHGIPG